VREGCYQKEKNDTSIRKEIRGVKRGERGGVSRQMKREGQVQIFAQRGHPPTGKKKEVLLHQRKGGRSRERQNCELGRSAEIAHRKSLFLQERRRKRTSSSREEKREKNQEGKEDLPGRVGGRPRAFPEKEKGARLPTLISLY